MLSVRSGAYPNKPASQFLAHATYEHFSRVAARSELEQITDIEESQQISSFNPYNPSRKMILFPSYPLAKQEIEI